MADQPKNHPFVDHIKSTAGTKSDNRCFLARRGQSPLIDDLLAAIQTAQANHDRIHARLQFLSEEYTGRFPLRYLDNSIEDVKHGSAEHHYIRVGIQIALEVLGDFPVEMVSENSPEAERLKQKAKDLGLDLGGEQ